MGNWEMKRAMEGKGTKGEGKGEKWRRDMVSGEQSSEVGMYRISGFGSGWPDIRPFFLIRFRLRFRPK